jgi:hypothetical protein
MADEPQKSGHEPNLELPSLLSFGRRRKRRTGQPAQGQAGADQTVAEEPSAEASPPDTDPDTDPLAADPVAEPRGGLTPSADKAKRLPPVPPPTARVEASAVRPGTPPPPDPPPPLPEEPPAPEPPEEPRLAEQPGPVVEPAATEQTTMLPVMESDPHVAEPAAPVAAEDHARPADARVDELPVISPRLAAVVTGGLVGLVGVLLAYFASRGCETVRGVGSCGGMGLLALLMILAIQVVLGAIILKAWRIADPTSTSFLGVGLVAVFVLLFLLSSLESVWMILVIPVVSSMTFLLSWWVTTTFVEVPDSS